MQGYRVTAQGWPKRRGIFSCPCGHDYTDRSVEELNAWQQVQELVPYPKMEDQGDKSIRFFFTEAGYQKFQQIKNLEVCYKDIRVQAKDVHPKHIVYVDDLQFACTV